MSSVLPIDEVLPEVVELLRRHNCIVLKAPAGAGKTTRVPPALLDAGIAEDGQILLLQPRRLAARAAAARMSAERMTPLGDLIGYQVRFESRVSRKTRIVSMTEGVFVRRMQDDPFLEGTNVVIFDEFHERSLDADVALAMARRIQTEIRPNLKIVVMSATLAAEPIANYLGGAPIVESAGRTFSIEIRYLKHSRTEPIPNAAASAVKELLAQVSGDLLVFLPGVGEIRRTADLLESIVDGHDGVVMELYADLPLEQQQLVLSPCNRRKIVLATNVAETSITIDGVTGVVDTGWARVNRLDPTLGLNRLELQRISKASADQRAGRSGRTAPGVCMRLWTEREQQGLAVFETPEIGRVDLAGAVLELMSWGERDVKSFPWYESPPVTSLAQADAVLRLLMAIDEGGVTELGRAMVRLPVHPRIARLMLEGARHGVEKETALVAALLSERDPFRNAQNHTQRRKAEHRSESDVLDRAAAIEAFEITRRRDTMLGEIDSGSAKSILRTRDQLLRLLSGTREERSTAERLRVAERNSNDDENLLRAIFAGFADRIARRRQLGSHRAVMLGGRGVKLIESSAVDAEFFVCVEIQETGQSESLVRQASAVRREWLPQEQLLTAVEVRFDGERGRVVAFRRVRFGDLVLEEAPTAVPQSEETRELLAREAASRLDLKTLLSEEARLFLARWQCLAKWMPDLDLPFLGDDPLLALLPQLCIGSTSLDDLRKSPALKLLKSQLAPHQLVALEREAPSQMKVPSGSWITLQYEQGKPPVLAVRIQELFGMKATPHIAGGRIPVLLHLLAPNMRPQQVTTDLASFWKNTYPVVRGELRRRYPKHSWPEDPYTAIAEHRPKRKPSS
jgi:ATP-dependent helicase HrpB